MFPLSKGRVTAQAHVAIPEGTYEEEMGREGFFSRVSHLYRVHPPTSWTRIEGPLKPRALDLLKLEPTDQRSPDGTPVAFLRNDDLTLSFSRLGGQMPHFRRNADGDEVWFIHRGEGLFESDFGQMRFEKGDYLVVPRGTTFRLAPDHDDCAFLVIEARNGQFSLPDKGLLGPHAIFDVGVMQTPELVPYEEREGEWEVRVKRADAYTSVYYPFYPLDVVGWKGDLTPWKLNVRDIRPVMSHRYHLPPSAHTTFLAPNFVICTFAPRPFESDPEALRVPFYHRNIDYEEVLFYHEGDFFSRAGIAPGMLTFHPHGLHHGPHPKAFAKAQGKSHTDEYAVMIDARNPLHLTEAGQSVEWQEYWKSWQ